MEHICKLGIMTPFLPQGCLGAGEPQLTGLLIFQKLEGR